LILLLADEETPMSARIGVGVVMEELEGDPVLLQGLETLIALSESELANVRADATHFLGLIRHPDAQAPIRQRLDDPNPDVREIAEEALQMLTDEKSNG
jgi:HEAT repeat protein